jgi:hypothetical protein
MNLEDRRITKPNEASLRMRMSGKCWNAGQTEAFMSLRVLTGVLSGALVLVVSGQLEQQRPISPRATAPPKKVRRTEVESRRITPPPGVPRNAEPREFNGIIYYIVPVR